MRTLSILLLFILFQISATGQKDYFIRGPSLSHGVKIIDGGELLNSSVCMVRIGKTVTEYSPYDVNEYGFADGRVYLSRKIFLSDSIKQVFLERLTSGNASLYFYRGQGCRTFFLEKEDSVLTELADKWENKGEPGYREKLHEMTSDCPEVSTAARLVTYKKASLTKFIERYDRCVKRPFPYLKYGFFVSYGTTRLIKPADLNHPSLDQMDIPRDGNWVFSIFIDYPILVSDFSLCNELSFFQYDFSASEHIENKDIDFVANVSGFNLPFFIRYRLPIHKIRPYLNAGGMYTYHLKNESTIYEAFIDQPVVTTGYVDETQLISDQYIGYIFGGGLEYDILFRKSVFFEIRYRQQYGFSEGNSFVMSGLSFSAGFHF